MNKMAACGLVCVVLFSAPRGEAVEGQLKIVDLTYNHSGWYKHIDFLTQPSNWQSPLNYYRGNTYVRFEVFRFNGPNKISLHWCYFQDKHVKEKHACSSMKTITEPGVYYDRRQNSGLWQSDVIDWSRKLMNFMEIDNACGVPAQGCKGKADVRITVFIVVEGQKFNPPADWDCPNDWGCGGTSTGGGTTGGGTTGGGTTGGGTTGGGTTTEEPRGLIALWSPQGGENLQQGATEEIIWTTTGDISAVTIEISTDSGNTWQTLVSSTQNDGSHVWQITQAPESGYRIRVSDAGNPGVFATSLSDFQILDPAAPNPGAGQTAAQTTAGGGSCGAVPLGTGGSPTASSLSGWLFPLLLLAVLYVWRREARFALTPHARPVPTRGHGEAA